MSPKRGAILTDPPVLECCRECRERGLIYGGPIRVIFNIQRDDGGRLRIEKNLGDLPVMVSEANLASDLRGWGGILLQGLSAALCGGWLRYDIPPG